LPTFEALESESSRIGAANLAQVRKLALSLLEMEDSRQGKSVAKKRKIAD